MRTIKGFCDSFPVCTATLCFLFWCTLSATVAMAQTTKGHEGIGAADTQATAIKNGQSGASLADLAQRDTLTVRALIAFNQVPPALMRPLIGLRTRGIDVLGESPKSLAKLLEDKTITLEPAERNALSQVLDVMQDVRASASADSEVITAGQSSQTEEITPAIVVPSRPAPPPLPPMQLPPALPMVELGSAQYAGMISTAKEATRTLMGEMSETDGRRFEKRWAAYYDYPSPEIIDYYRAATPLLSEFLNIRAAIASTSSAFDEAWSEAMLAAEYDSEEGADAALAQADMLKDYLVALKARGDALSEALQGLGDVPDPAIAKETAQTRHKSAIDTIKSLFVESPLLEGVWFGAVEYDKDFWIKGIKGTPLLFVVYAVGDPAQPTYRALCLDAADYDEKTDPYIEIFGMNDGENPNFPAMLAYFDDTQLKHTYEVKDEGDAMVITVSAAHLEEGSDSLDYPPPVALDTVETAYGKVRSEQELERAELEAAKLSTLGIDVVKTAALDEINDVRRHNQWTPVFVQTVRQWLNERPFSAESTLAQDRQAFSAMFAKTLGPQASKSAGQVAQTPLPTAAKESSAAQRPDTASPGEKNTAEEAERTAKVERIQFHQQNILIIERNLQRDRAELERETDPERRATLEFRVVGALSDLQSEKDLATSIETGEIVRSRSAFDDYAHTGFIANIRKAQQKIEHFEHSSASLFKLAGMLPGSDGSEARAFVERQLTPEVRLNMDQETVKRIADALGKKVEGHYLGQQAKSDEDAAYANLGLEAAQNVKSGADTSMMVLSLFGGQYVDASYQAATGYIEGGPTEAVLRTASMFGPTAGAAAEAMRGYRDGGMQEALKRGAVSFATSKGMEYGMGKVLKSARPQPGQKGALQASAKGGPVMPTATTKPTAGGTAPSLAKLPTSADQRALKQFQQARKQGEDMVQDFQQAQKRLTDAGAAGASAEEIIKLQDQVRSKVGAVNGSPHAKNFLKYKGEAGAQRAYSAHLRAVHADVEAKFHATMQSKGWQQQPLKEFRNATSAGSVGMDFDIGLDEQMARSLSRDGKPAKLNQWQEDAQQAWNEAYHASTGGSAGQAWESVTTSGHAESYKDLAWLAQNKSGVAKAWGQQAADVTRYKSWHMANDPSLSKMTKLQEISRGAAKDMQTKLNPLLDSVKPGPGSLGTFNEARSHWNQVRTILADFGENNIDPITADRRIRELTGGKSIPDVVEDMTYLLEGAIKFGKRS